MLIIHTKSINTTLLYSGCPCSEESDPLLGNNGNLTGHIPVFMNRRARGCCVTYPSTANAPYRVRTWASTPHVPEPVAQEALHPLRVSAAGPAPVSLPPECTVVLTVFLAVFGAIFVPLDRHATISNDHSLALRLLRRHLSVNRRKPH